MHKDTIFYKNQTIRCGNRMIDLSTPLVMGILNTTPDSFYDGGRFTSREAVKAQIEKMVSEGADIIDIGAYSSRPGAEDISTSKELERLLPALEIIREIHPTILVSVDTFRSEVARQAIENFNIEIINDISGGEIDPDMYDLIAEKKIPYIMMHMPGTPQNMQNNTHYKHILKDLVNYFAEKIEMLYGKGINDLIIDPGFGFGKTIDQNFQILSGLESFRLFEQPLLIGLSRKSMIYKYLGIDTENALGGTIALNTIALQKGAAILRVHDVKEAKECILLNQKLLFAQQENINLLMNVN